MATCACQCNYCTCNCNYCTCNCNYCTCNVHNGNTGTSVNIVGTPADDRRKNTKFPPLTSSDIRLLTSTMNSIKTAINAEISIRGATAVSWGTSGDLNTFAYSSDMVKVKNAINACLVADGGSASFNFGDTITSGFIVKKNTLQEIQDSVNALQNVCICNCNYCTCNCNYCTCNCNYCACNCNYCTCQCNYCTCNCNYCTCNCNYSCTCNCNYSSDARLKDDIEYF